MNKLRIPKNHSGISKTLRLPENIVDDIIEHYNKNLKNTKFNAMFAVGSKFEAMRVKEIFDKKNALTTAVIISEDDDRNANTEQKKYVINEAKKLYKDYVILIKDKHNNYISFDEDEKIIHYFDIKDVNTIYLNNLEI